MTKKDYIKIAAALREALESAKRADNDLAVEVVSGLTKQLCDVLQADYKGGYAFSRDRFFAAAGMR